MAMKNKEKQRVAESAAGYDPASLGAALPDEEARRGLAARIAHVCSTLTNVQAAEFLGVSTRSITNYVNGIRPPDAEVLTRISQAGWNANWLLTGEGPERLADAMSASNGADSQPVRLDADRLASLIETVDSALRLTGRQLSAKGKAGVVAALYATETWRGSEAVTTALTAILNAIKEEADGQ